MTLGIMQPYFMPYLGYFSLIKHVDHFILFDTPQFMRHGWIERNQVLKLNGEAMYVKVPLKKHSRSTSIKDIEVNNTLNWQDKILAQLVHYKKKAPYYNEVIDLLKTIFEESTGSITILNYKSLLQLLEYLDIKTPISIWSEMDIQIDDVKAPDEWALNICKALNAKQYYNPIGGKTFFNSQKFRENGIVLKFLELEPIPYKQFDNVFVPFLSIIDVMMFNSVNDIRLMLDKYNFKT